MRTRSFIAVLAVLAFVGLLVFGLLSKGSSGVAVGEVAPVATLPRLEGSGEGSLADYRGKWVLVNFWASWCGPCKEEAPDLQAFQERHRSQGFTVLGIDSRDLSDDGRAFVERYGLTYPQLHDGDGANAHEYGTIAFPENFLVDPRGKVRLLHRGVVSDEYLQQYVVPLLPRGNR